jgi:bacillithiol system protein YtxJ
VYLVDVVHSRPLSRYIAERLGIVHASPQAIILRAGVPAWHGSHFDLRADTMVRQLEALKEGGERSI